MKQTAMLIPDPFLRNIRNSFGAEGECWLADLPELINNATRHWVTGNPNAMTA